MGDQSPGSNAEARTNLSRLIMPLRRRSKLLVEPDVFHPRPVERAVDHQRKVFDVRLPAGGAAVVEDDRPGTVCRQLSFDLPEDPAAMARVGGGDRLMID